MSAPNANIWKPLEGIPPGADNWRSRSYETLVAEWHALHRQITETTTEKRLLDSWLLEKRRAFAIETGQIEGLYTLKRGVTEQLITEGLEGVRSSHTVENIHDATIKGLLRDQEEAIELVFEEIENQKPLTEITIKRWHETVTKHQRSLTGRTTRNDETVHVELPFNTKGHYKERENNPVTGDGTLFEYCPPTQVETEMKRLIDLYENIRTKGLATSVEAAWLHHRFVRTHPFEDGNGRVARLLMTYVYARNGEVSPIITSNEKEMYYRALSQADQGNLLAFAEHLRVIATPQLEFTITLTKDLLSGTRKLHHPNGGITDENGYHRVIQAVDIKPGT